MAEGVLSKNLGIPLVIAVAKADVRDHHHCSATVLEERMC